MIRDGVWRESRQINYDSFKHVKMQKNQDFDYVLDPTSILREKAVCQPLSSWGAEYDTKYHRDKYKRFLKPSLQEV